MFLGTDIKTLPHRPTIEVPYPEAAKAPAQLSM
jgi:hypothetical protein